MTLNLMAERSVSLITHTNAINMHELSDFLDTVLRELMICIFNSECLP